MINSYSHIQILQDGTPKHLGGNGQPVLYFDSTFFNGKYILLFDDVITRGDSMFKYYYRMEKMGAIVIGGLSIGKTKHERTEINSAPIDALGND